MMIVLKNIWYEIRALFGIKGGVSGSARIGEVLKHFQVMRQELSEGLLELQNELSDNQDRVMGLQDRIDDIKADNMQLGYECESARNLRTGLTKLMGQEDDDESVN